MKTLTLKVWTTVDEIRGMEEIVRYDLCPSGYRYVRGPFTLQEPSGEWVSGVEVAPSVKEVETRFVKVILPAGLVAEVRRRPLNAESIQVKCYSGEAVPIPVRVWVMRHGVRLEIMGRKLVASVEKTEVISVELPPRYTRYPGCFEFDQEWGLQRIEVDPQSIPRLESSSYPTPHASWRSVRRNALATLREEGGELEISRKWPRMRKELRSRYEEGCKLDQAEYELYAQQRDAVLATNNEMLKAAWRSLDPFEEVLDQIKFE